MSLRKEFMPQEKNRESQANSLESMRNPGWYETTANEIVGKPALSANLRDNK